MNENRVKRNELLARRVITGLEKRNMTGYYVETKEEALKKALEIIPEGSSCGWGGSMSIEEIGLKDAIRNGNYTALDRDGLPPEEQKKVYYKILSGSDYFLASCNAVTADGILVNIDANSNRVAALAYGPEHVLYIVGMNKVAKDLDAAIARARGEAATINCQRFDLNTPCHKTGTCANCLVEGSICCNFLITRREMHPGRVTMILVGESLGF